MAFADIFAYIATALGLFTFTPQVIRAAKTKNTKDLSLITYILLLTATQFWNIYGVMTQATPVIVANSIVGAHAFAIIVLKLKYK